MDYKFAQEKSYHPSARIYNLGFILSYILYYGNTHRSANQNTIL
jgi:hypothetical protein